MLTQELLGEVGDVGLERLAARFLSFDVRECAIDPIVGPLPPVDVPRMAGSVLWNVWLVVGPEAEVLRTERGPVAREPLPLGRWRVVLRLAPVRHRRVPLRLGPPAPAAAVVVLVVVGSPHAMSRGGGRRYLGVGIATPRLVLERPPWPQAGVAEIVERPEEPEFVPRDRTTECGADLPVLLRLARERVSWIHEEEVRPEILRRAGLVARERSKLRVERPAAVKRIAAGFGEHVDGRAGEVRVLGLRPGGDDPDLLDRVIVDVDERPEGTGAGGCGVDSVDQENVLVCRASVCGRALEFGRLAGRP